MSKEHPVRTLHFGIRVSDLRQSLAFYTAVGYRAIGRVEGTTYGTLTMLQLPDDPFVTIELVYDSETTDIGPGTGFNHVVIQVDSLEKTRDGLADSGIEPEPIEFPGGPNGPRSFWITDPDGYRIEVLQWPDGHADGITEEDFRRKA
jgi:lactoylglutathione lyase